MVGPAVGRRINRDPSLSGVASASVWILGRRGYWRENKVRVILVPYPRAKVGTDWETDDFNMTCRLEVVKGRVELLVRVDQQFIVCSSGLLVT